ncbi:MAG: helix-turn-helix transcriptional regulator [Terriglobia bacterium]|jgi:transcriptional regulator with XRE-family HTH domain|nr:helix-turn-helix transcriptional regulator [Terriglobia bacterium]
MKPKGTWKNIGEYIRFRRIKEGMTIRELAGLAGMTSTLLFNIESGKNDPKLKSVEKIAMGFGEPEMKFLGRFYGQRRHRNRGS